jgi:hypothetical protein
MQKSDINDRTREYCKNNPLKPDKMFSEKEVHKIISSYQAHLTAFNTNFIYDKWFKQFKNK